MSAAKPKQEFKSAERIAQLFGLNGRTTHRILMEAGVPQQVGKGFAFALATKAIIHHYKRQSEAVENRISAHRESQAESDARTAAVKALEAEGRVLFKSDVKAVWEDGLTVMRQKIEHAPFLTPDLKKKICLLLAEVKLETP